MKYPVTPNNEMNSDSESVRKQEQSKTCFVIMPISDTEGYSPGHFDRVYDYIIKPACEQAGFSANRADETSKPNFIVVDILRQIVNSDIAICDLSSRNSNVFFELGLRQAFNLKTVLIKDSKTPRSFDISGFRCIDYDENLRVDNVEKTVGILTSALKETIESRREDVNSLIELLAVDVAKLPDKVRVSDDTNVLLREIKSVQEDLKQLYLDRLPRRPIIMRKATPMSVILPNGEQSELSAKLYKKDIELPFNDEYGVIVDKTQECTIIRTRDGFVRLNDDDPLWKELTIMESSFR